MVKDQHPQAVKEAIASVLPVWLEAFKMLLSVDPQGDVGTSTNWDGLSVRIQIFKVLSCVFLATCLLTPSFPLQLADTGHYSYFVPTCHDTIPQ
jgi:hypothetical protein